MKIKIVVKAVCISVVLLASQTAADQGSSEDSSSYWVKTNGLEKDLEISDGPNIWIISLYQNEHLKSSKYAGYANSILKEDESCKYHGKIRNNPNSWAEISLCGKISGLFYDGQYTREISSTSETGEKGLIRIRIISNTEEAVNEKAEILASSQNKHRTTRSNKNLQDVITVHNMGNRTRAVKWQRYIEVWIVVDKTQFGIWARNVTKTHRQCQEIMNFVNSIFAPLEIFTFLTGVEIWREDKTHIDSDHEESLKRFTEYRKQLYKKGKRPDYTLLLTGVDLKGETIGYGFVNAMCHFTRSAGIVQHGNDSSPLFVAGTIAHEMGHALGALHDSPSCVTDEREEFGIMVSKSTTRVHWSNCTKVYFAKYIDRFHCLRDIPDIPSQFSICGNGVLESPEQCDCGVGGPCSTCCNVKNCTLKAKARCGSGTCCNLETCKFYPAGTECREEANECDLPEYCSGTNSTCPRNYFKHNGYKCHGGQGYCFNGTCSNKDLLCQDLVNPAARFPEPKYLHQVRWPFEGQMYCKEYFCQTPLNIGWIPEAKSLMRDHDFFRFRSSPLLLFKANESLLANRPRVNGLPCGNDMMCMNSSCVRVPAPSEGFCKSNCSNHGICNNNGHCHCFPQFAPPSCQYYGHGGSIDSNPIRNKEDDYRHETRIFLVLLFVIIVILVSFCFWTTLNDFWESQAKSSLNQLCPKWTYIYNIFCFPCIWMGWIESPTTKPRPAPSHSFRNASDSRYVPNTSSHSAAGPSTLKSPPVDRNLKPKTASKPNTSINTIPLDQHATKVDPISKLTREEQKRKNLKGHFLPSQEKLSLNPLYLSSPSQNRTNSPSIGLKPTGPPPERPPKPKKHFVPTENKSNTQQPRDLRNKASNYYEV